MAQEPKPGKFVYNLETVLKVRSIKEKKEQEKFAFEQRRFLVEQQKAEELKKQQSERQGELREKFKGGPIEDFGEVLRRHVHLTELKKEVDLQEKKRVEAMQRRDIQREKLVQSMKERQIIEKDKENKFVEHDDLMKQLEMKFIDEVAMTRFIHSSDHRH